MSRELKSSSGSKEFDAGVKELGDRTQVPSSHVLVFRKLALQGLGSRAYRLRAGSCEQASGPGPGPALQLGWEECDIGVWEYIIQ